MCFNNTPRKKSHCHFQQYILNYSFFSEDLTFRLGLNTQCPSGPLDCSLFSACQEDTSLDYFLWEVGKQAPRSVSQRKMFQTEDGWRRRVTMAQPGFHRCHGHVLVTSTQATESLGPVLPFELAYTLHDRACGLHSLRAAKKKERKRLFWCGRSSG